MPINFCPSCGTGLANEEVNDGKCDRREDRTEVQAGEHLAPELRAEAGFAAV